LATTLVHVTNGLQDAGHSVQREDAETVPIVSSPKSISWEVQEFDFQADEDATRFVELNHLLFRSRGIGVGGMVTFTGSHGQSSHRVHVDLKYCPKS
jgi:hypothetical protein